MNKLCAGSVLALSILVASNALAGPAISTVAGGGNPPDGLGDNGPATSAALNVPVSLAVDAAGNLFISDQDNDLVRKVDTHGIITVAAGNGQAGFSGDGGAATQAALSSPAGIAIDAAGDLIISDLDNERIRKVGPNGAINTVAGTGKSAFSGDGGPAVQAALSVPQNVAMDSLGDLLIADTDNNRVREVAPGGTITTVVGTGDESFSGDGGPAAKAAVFHPWDLAVDGQGSLFIADTNNSRIRKVSPDGIITTVAGTGAQGFSGDGGAATQAELNGMEGLAVDSLGDLFIADTGNNRVREVTTDGTITTVAGSSTGGLSGDGGSPVQAELNGPEGLTIDAKGNLYIADTKNDRVREVTGVAAPGLVAGLPSSRVPGDLDGDGKVTLVDVSLALRGLVGLKTLTANQIAAIDFSHTDRITIEDVTLLLRYVVGLLKSLPALA